MLPSFLALPPEQLALLRLVADEAAARGLPAYIVGGFVRDLVLNRPGLDFDIVVAGDAVALARALAKKHGGKVTAHARFGTARIESRESRIENRAQSDHSLLSTLYSLDFTTARRETYARPGALPEVTPSTIEDDLRRRDFTINTLAVRLDGAHFGELYDPYRGASDIERGLVRVLHDASFSDDPTRILRAVRYEQRYGFQIEAHTLELIAEARPLIKRLSAERVRHELDLVLDEPHAPATLARLDELGVLNAVAEPLPWSAELHRRLETGLDSVPAPGWGLGQLVSGIPLRWILGYSLWLLDLNIAEIDSIQTRLAFPLAVLKPVRTAARLRADLPALSGAKPPGSGGAKPSKWVERLERIPLPAVYALYLVSGEAALETYAARWRHIQPQTDGAALKALGVPPGPAYKKILLRLRAAWLDGEVASAEQEKELLEKLLTI